MANPAAKVGWKLVGGTATAVAGKAARKGVTSTYRSMRGTEPPGNPASPRTTWVEALLWAALSGVAVELVRLAVERVAAQGWERATGALPPGMDPKL